MCQFNIDWLLLVDDSKLFSDWKAGYAKIGVIDTHTHFWFERFTNLLQINRKNWAHCQTHVCAQSRSLALLNKWLNKNIKITSNNATMKAKQKSNATTIVIIAQVKFFYEYRNIFENVVQLPANGTCVHRLRKHKNIFLFIWRQKMEMTWNTPNFVEKKRSGDIILNI